MHTASRCGRKFFLSEANRQNERMAKISFASDSGVGGERNVSKSYILYLCKEMMDLL